MKSEKLKNEDMKNKTPKPEKKESTNTTLSNSRKGATGLIGLQQCAGNRAVQRLIAQRSDLNPYELDDATANRINNQRGGGQALDNNIHTHMGSTTGYDFKDVRVHTSPESDKLSRELGAKAFTTGNDIFFSEGQYDPYSSGGQELITHELTHVVQQNSGRVTGGGKMTVNPPNDVYEQEADSISKATLFPGSSPEVQRQETEEEEEEFIQTKAIQRQDIPEEEEEVSVKTQRTEELEEEV